MSAENINYTPFPEANTDRVRTNLHLPFALETKMGLNVKKVEQLCQISGFRGIKIQNLANPTISQVNLQVVGVTKDGSAFSGGSQTEMVPTFEPESNRENVDTKESRWADLTININTEELKRRFLDARKAVNQVDPWVLETDKAIRLGLFKAGLKNLIDLPTKGDKFAPIFCYTVTLLSYVPVLTKPTNNTNQIITDLVQSFIVAKIAWSLRDYLRYGIEKDGEGTRYSLFIGPEIDRAAILCALSLGKPLVKKL